MFCGMRIVNAPPGSSATGWPFAVSDEVLSTSPRSELTNPGMDGAIAWGTITRGGGLSGPGPSDTSMPADPNVRAATTPPAAMIARPAQTAHVVRGSRRGRRS